jgi:predicted DsbA family dithiol-disulfide isomerase
VGVAVQYFTDPACPISWGTEPEVRRLAVEFGDHLDWKLVMGGLGRDYSGHEKGALVRWVEDAAEIEMPIDPLLWKEAPISSTYPACIAVKAAGEQGLEAQLRYLRALREGMMCFRRKLDSLEPLVEEARRARLDVERFRVDAVSHAMVEAFGADLELTRDVPEGSPRTDRVPLPTLRIGDRWFFGRVPYDELAAAAEAVGASRAPGRDHEDYHRQFHCRHRHAITRDGRRDRSFFRRESRYWLADRLSCFEQRRLCQCLSCFARAVRTRGPGCLISHDYRHLLSRLLRREQSGRPDWRSA